LLRNHDIMCDYLWNWVVVSLSLNTIKFSWILVHLHWYCDSFYPHVKVIKNIIHPIISCPQNISFSIFWHVRKSMCIWQYTKCSNKRSYTSNNGINSIDIHLTQYFFDANKSFPLFFFHFLVSKFWQNLTKT